MDSGVSKMVKLSQEIEKVHAHTIFCFLYLLKKGIRELYNFSKNARSVIFKNLVIIKDSKYLFLFILFHRL